MNYIPFFLSKTLSPSHAEVSLIDFGKKINVMGVEVKDNDLIHADVHGFVTFSDTLINDLLDACLLYTSPSPRDRQKSRMPSSA